MQEDTASIQVRISIRLRHTQIQEWQMPKYKSWRYLYVRGEGASVWARGHRTNWSSGPDHNQLLYESSLELTLRNRFDCSEPPCKVWDVRGPRGRKMVPELCTVSTSDGHEGFESDARVFGRWPRVVRWCWLRVILGSVRITSVLTYEFKL